VRVDVGLLVVRLPAFAVEDAETELVAFERPGLFDPEARGILGDERTMGETELTDDVDRDVVTAGVDEVEGLERFLARLRRKLGEAHGLGRDTRGREAIDDVGDDLDGRALVDEVEDAR
jgi:hypothetical protein